MLRIMRIKKIVNKIAIMTFLAHQRKAPIIKIIAEAIPRRIIQKIKFKITKDVKNTPAEITDAKNNPVWKIPSEIIKTHRKKVIKFTSPI